MKTFGTPILGSFAPRLICSHLTHWGLQWLNEMSANVQPAPPSDVDQTSGPSVLTLEDSKVKVVAFLKKRLNRVKLHYHEFLAELTYLQGGGLLTDFESWRRDRPQDLMHALFSGHLDADDLNGISAFMSGHLPMHEMFPIHVDSSQVDDMDDDSDEDFGRIVDESAIPVLVRKEVETLKRVLEFKRLGLWSRDATSLSGDDKQRSSDAKPSLSSLAPPPELIRPKDHLDYMFAEMRWLAEDFKKERHWKKVTAKKLAYAALKVYKEKAERSLKAERDEAARIRKQCALIARMVRDWWRQMDKIVQTKQKARLTARHQQAMSTHLGHVIETTERYTMWLTEGIIGAKQPTVTDQEASDKETARNEKAKEAEPSKESDAEFVADEDESTDDEETIAKEEEMARRDADSKEDESREVAALCAEAEASIDDLLPPGYLEHLQQLHEAGCMTLKRGADELSLEEDEIPPRKKRRPDGRFNRVVESSTDDEMVAEQEARGRAKRDYENNCDEDNDGDNRPSRSESKEVSQLEAEADMSIEELLARYGLKSDQLTHWKEQSNALGSSSSSTVDTSSATDSASDSGTSDSESLSETSSVFETEGDDEEAVEEPGLKELLSDDEKENLEKNDSSMPDNPELRAIANVAMSAQPQGNTLASVAEPVKTPFLLAGTLREYQVVGLSWLVAIYQKRLNGILADEMGLGKTIQTIALLAYLACELGIWGPHLIVVPNSVILNWEVEFKKWCPGFKILTYFGSAKERKAKRKGWTKTNAFHVCITSYRLAIQDSSAFKRKKWKYLILDEAQNIKNFKSQRWQTLLTFNSQRRLLLTGTPLQNSLMELWSLMHFLMPNIFQSHREFQEWFASPLTGMIEGNSEYNEQLVMRLHKVLRPFLLRRLKEDVERQMPKKYEHVILCRLSKRQRYLYDDFMSLSTTKDTLASGQFLSVMNILMQLRKVCNHPNLFEPRPITSPFHIADGEVRLEVPRLVAQASQPLLVTFHPGTPSAWTQARSLDWLDRAGAAARLLGQTANLAEMARDLPAFVARRVHQLQAKPGLISVVEDSDPVDFVSRQREFFNDLKKRKGLKMDDSCSGRRHQPPIFLSRSVVLEVNEEITKSVDGYYHSGTKPPYPILPRPVLKGVSYIRAQRRPNPWDAGIPKSVLRLRHIDRQHRISLLARVNERRCANPYGTPNFETTSIPTPDLVYFLTSAVICRPVKRPTYFATGAWVACQRALRTWPDKRACDDFDGPPTYLRHPTFVVGGLGAPSLQAAELERLQAFYGPEAAFPVRAVSSKALRQMLFSPVDCLEYFSGYFDKFLITTPSAISSGVRLHTSCASVHRIEMQQEAVFEGILQPFLEAARVFKHCIVHKKNSTLVKVHCACDSLTFRSWLMPAQLYRVCNSHLFQFPDPRLIQYDCGKLQRLDLLLRELYADEHRVLIFTQMARMLDILEQFLAYHGYRYLRLDGATKVEQRQVLMERFNMDSRIFVFILSTRSGGLGVNLTGADTVIFYDSDWNPTMDAQAQDRCHRIGQTRDVHIYRLISERTVEENILRKANQKRLLSDVAIEGGKFTTAFFKQSIISDLFAEPSGLLDLLQDKEEREAARTKKADVEEGTKENSGAQSPPSPPLLTTRSGRQIRWKGATSILLNAKQQSSTAVAASNQAAITDSQWVAALDACEDDENDRAAAKRALDEAKADLEEFDESKPIEGAESGEGDVKISDTDAAPSIEGSTSDPLARFVKKRQQEANAIDFNATVGSDALTPEAMVERELAEFESLLRPIERFGVNHLESFQDDTLNLELEQFEAQIEESKKEWKLNTLKALHEADEERAELEEDEILYCDPDYDPEAARLAELGELERAEEMEGMTGRGIRGRRSRGGGHFRGRGPRVRGGAVSIGRGAARRVDNERFTIRSRDSDASSSTTARFRLHRPSPDNDESSVDRAAWFHARYRDNAGGRRRLPIPDYVDWDEEEDEDEPEATDIWSPSPVSSRRDFAISSALTTSLPPKRGRGRGRGRGTTNGSLISMRGRRRPSDYWRPEGAEVTYPKRRRRYSSSLYADDMEDSASTSVRSDSMISVENYAVRAGQRGRPSPAVFQPTRRLGPESTRPSSRMTPNIIRSSNPYQYYRRYDATYSPASSNVSYVSPFSGPIGVPSPGLYHQPVSPSGMLQHNSKVLNSLMQTAVEPRDETSIFKHPPLPAREEEVLSRYQPMSTQYRPRVRCHTPRHRLTLNPQPRLQSFFRPTVGIPMRSANIAPPRQYHPPSVSPTQVVQEEPTVSVQTLSNGAHSVQPLRQVLSSPSSQPVFVITRQLKTSSGEVYQQRITQPVQPPTKYVQVVRRVSQVSNAVQPQGVMPSAPRPIIRLNPPLTRVTSAPTSTTVNTTTATTNTAATALLPGRKIIRVVRSTAPNAIRILPPRIPP
ncbi:helicase [Echinococcus multilocularis]|uniref:Helicase n=1 Tax=Echinococcus multilocularis TaxID=6211 RepID=A0A087W195_ECHMU|nr:helicase [Echinococcus multilocularis]